MDQVIPLGSPTEWRQGGGGAPLRNRAGLTIASLDNVFRGDAKPYFGEEDMAGKVGSGAGEDDWAAGVVAEARKELESEARMLRLQIEVAEAAGLRTPDDVVALTPPPRRVRVRDSSSSRRRRRQRHERQHSATPPRYGEPAVGRVTDVGVASGFVGREATGSLHRLNGEPAEVVANRAHMMSSHNIIIGAMSDVRTSPRTPRGFERSPRPPPRLSRIGGMRGDGGGGRSVAAPTLTPIIPGHHARSDPNPPRKDGLHVQHPPPGTTSPLPFMASLASLYEVSPREQARRDRARRRLVADLDSQVREKEARTRVAASVQREEELGDLAEMLHRSIDEFGQPLEPGSPQERFMKRRYQTLMADRQRSGASIMAGGDGGPGHVEVSPIHGKPQPPTMRDGGWTEEDWTARRAVAAAAGYVATDGYRSGTGRGKGGSGKEDQSWSDARFIGGSQLNGESPSVVQNRVNMMSGEGVMANLFGRKPLGLRHNSKNGNLLPMPAGVSPSYGPPAPGGYVSSVAAAYGSPSSGGGARSPQPPAAVVGTGRMRSSRESALGGRRLSYRLRPPPELDVSDASLVDEHGDCGPRSGRESSAGFGGSGRGRGGGGGGGIAAFASPGRNAVRGLTHKDGLRSQGHGSPGQDTSYADEHSRTPPSQLHDRGEGGGSRGRGGGRSCGASPGPPLSSRRDEQLDELAILCNHMLREHHMLRRELQERNREGEDDGRSCSSPRGGGGRQRRVGGRAARRGEAIGAAAGAAARRRRKRERGRARSIEGDTKKYWSP